MSISNYPEAVNTVVVPHPHVRLVCGEPFIAGTRIRVARLWELVEGKTEIAVICKRYPQVSQAKVFDALAFAFDNRHLFG